MFPYDTTESDPPAPCADVEVTGSRPITGVIRIVKSLLDSGADMTCIPKNAIPRECALRYSFAEAVDFEGNRYRRKTWYLTLRLCGQHFPNVQTLELNSDTGLIGRDVLNSFRLVLDGPCLEWTIE